MSQIWECTQKKHFPENFGKCKEKILQGDLVTVKLKKKQNHQQTLTSRFSHIVGNKAKGRISKRVFQENKARQIFRKTNISYSLIRTRAYQGVRNVRFSENLACFVFLKHPFWDSPFCLITDDTIQRMNLLKPWLTSSIFFTDENRGAVKQLRKCLPNEREAFVSRNGNWHNEVV